MKMICSNCKNYLSTTLAPNDVELRTYSNDEWSKVLQNGVVEGWKFPIPLYDVWRCPKCEQLYCYEDKGLQRVKIYTLNNKLKRALNKTKLEKIVSVCGKSFSADSDKYIVYTDIEWDAYLVDEFIDPKNIPAPQFDVIKCNNCKRIYVLKKGSDKVEKVYDVVESSD